MSPNTLRDLQLPYRDPRKKRLVREWYPLIENIVDRACHAENEELPDIRKRYAEITGGIKVESIDSYRERLKNSAITVRNAAIQILESASGLSFGSIVRYLEPSAAPDLPQLPPRQSRTSGSASDSPAAPFQVMLFFEAVRFHRGHAWRMLQYEGTDKEGQITFTLPEIYREHQRDDAYRRLLIGIDYLRMACQTRKHFEINLNAEPSWHGGVRRKVPNNIAIFFQELQNGYAWSMWQVEERNNEDFKVINFPLPEIYIPRERVRVLGWLLLRIEKLRLIEPSQARIKFVWGKSSDEDPLASKCETAEE